MIKTVGGTSRIVSPIIWTSLVTRSMFAVSDLWPAFRAPFLVKSSCKISRERWLELAQLRIESWMWSELFAIYWAPMLVTRGTGPHPAMSTNTHQEAICPLTCSTNSDAGGGFRAPPHNSHMVCFLCLSFILPSEVSLSCPWLKLPPPLLLTSIGSVLSGYSE